jgi:hypothetical protein
VQGLDATNQHQTSSVASHSKQRPSFVNMWSALNHARSAKSTKQSDEPCVAKHIPRKPVDRTRDVCCASNTIAYVEHYSRS